MVIKKNIILKVLIGIFAFLFLVLIFFKLFYNKKNITISENDYDNYVYKIGIDYIDEEDYIYFMEDNTIKTVKINEIYEIVPDCDCVDVGTGKFDYDYETINFSDETNKIVIEVFNDLYKKSGLRNFNVKDIEISEYQERVLLAIMINSEDIITLEDDLKYDYFSEEIFSKNSNYKIINSKMLINNSTENKIVNSIANYMNKIINEDFDDINETSKEFSTDLSEDYLGVDLKIEHLYIGSNKISFVYKQEGQLGANAITGINGYTFNLYNGTIIEFPGGYKEEYYNIALNNFMKTELYNNYSDELENDWKDILYDNMFLNGNWYVDGENVEFLIPAYLLGFDYAHAQVIDISVGMIDDMEI